MFSQYPLLALFALVAPSHSNPTSIAPNGTANPFYPCPASSADIPSCPYRCYTATGALLDQCFNEAQATTLINSLQNICVQCTVPDVPEDYPGGCLPLANYFSGSPPSPCGFENHRLRSCAWICGEAQVPFSLCSGTNATGPFELCERCLPQCSSPRIVFQPSFLPSNFSIASGDCSTQYGPQQTVACPYRCTFPTRGKFCSLTDQTGGFTQCTKCS